MDKQISSSNDTPRMSDEDPIVTIGIPFCHEPLEYFELAVKSVLAQSFKKWELILIADGASTELIQFATSIKDPRIRIVNDGKQLGLAARLNQLASLARGEFLARMDADDIMHPERISTSLNLFAQNPHLDIISTCAYQIDEKTHILGHYRFTSGPIRRASMLTRSPILHPTVITRTSWSRANAYDETFARAQDKELWVRAVHPGNYCRTEEELLFYRVPRGGIYKKHKKASRFDRRILELHGPGLIGFPKSILLMLRSRVKCITFGAIVLARGEAKLYERRFRPFQNSDELLVAKKIFNSVVSTTIPYK